MNRRLAIRAVPAAFVAAIATWHAAPTKADEGTPEAEPGVDRICGHAVRLSIGETAETPAGISIRLAEIKDHRCPQDAACVWAGYAEIRLDLAGPEWEARGYPATEYITVGLGVDDPGVRRYGPFVLILEGLSPTPRPSIETSLDEYEVALVLIELPER